MEQPAQTNQDHTTKNPKEIDVKQANKVLYISLGIIVVLILALVTGGFGLFSKGNQTQTNQTITGNVIDTSIPLQIGNSPILGNSSAPVTIYEFSDFSCPYCAAANGLNENAISVLKAMDSSWQAPVPNIIKDYVETGKVKIVFKYYMVHQESKPAYLVAMALYDQNPELFWKFQELAFANQNDVSDLAKMEDLAKSLGANIQKLQLDINSGIYDSRLADSMNMGKSNGVTGTPTFFINGKSIIGAKSYPAFKEIIDKELK